MATILTPEEKKAIIDAIQSNKPISERYRWLLFDHPHEAELVWPDKTNMVEKIAIPFQAIEYINASQAKNKYKYQDNNNGWLNKLIWGDNKLILSSLRKGAIRKQIDEAGGIKLIYIDPPFDIGANFSMSIEIGDGESLTKQPNIIEEIAYRDTWGKGVDSFIAMLYSRLLIMKELLHEDGFIFVHIGVTVADYVKIILDEIFGRPNFRNSIIVKRVTKNLQQQFETVSKIQEGHDVIFLYSKTSSTNFKPIKIKKEDIKEKDTNGYWKDFWSNADRPTMRYPLLTVTPKSGQWKWSRTRAMQAVKNYKEFEASGAKSVLDYWKSSGCDKEFIKRDKDKIKHWIAPSEEKLSDTLWLDVTAYERVKDYPTQKSEELLERIISNFSNKGDLVADFFCGSGTTLAVSEKLKRRWIGCDLSRFAINSSKKRIIDIQDTHSKSENLTHGFELLNLGHYERQYFMDVSPDSKKNNTIKNAWKKEQEYLRLILEAYNAKSIAQTPPFQGQKGNAMIYIGPIDRPITQKEISSITKSCIKYGFKRADILGFDFEMGGLPLLKDEAKQKGVDLAFRYIPNEVFDKRAVDKGQVTFYDVAYLEAKINILGKKVSATLLDFGVFYIQENIKIVTDNLRNGGSRVIVHNGQVLKIKKDKKGNSTKELLTKRWTDWIDYWAVDFNYDMGQESNNSSPVFKNNWQTFRTKSNRVLDLTTENFIYNKPGKYKVAIKLIDIFGNDTTKIFPINIR